MAMLMPSSAFLVPPVLSSRHQKIESTDSDADSTYFDAAESLTPRSTSSYTDLVALERAVYTNSPVSPFRAATRRDSFSKTSTNTGPALFVTPPTIVAPAASEAVPLSVRFATAGDLNSLRELYSKRPAALHERDKIGRSALMSAVIEGHQSVVEFLIDRGADVHARDHNGVTVLMHAIISSQEYLVRVLLAAFADPNGQGSQDGLTPLMLTCMLGLESSCKILLDAGADVNLVNWKYETALMYAAHHGFLPIVQLLLQHGANASALNSDGASAFTFSAAIGDVAICETLLRHVAGDHGFSVTPVPFQHQILSGVPGIGGDEWEDLSPLHVAALIGKEEVASLVLEAPLGPLLSVTKGISYVAGAIALGASAVDRLWWRDHQGRTPLMCAADCNHIQIGLNFLRRAGAGASALLSAVDHQGSTVLHYIARRGFVEFLNAIKAATSNPLPFEIVDTVHGTALTVAAYFGHLEIVQTLIAMGAQCNTRLHPMTPLLVATQQGHEEIACHIIRHLTDILPRRSKTRRASSASDLRKPDEVYLDTVLNMTDSNGWTALMFAAGKGLLGATKLLLARGADVNIRGKDNGATALMLATTNGRVAVVEQLVLAGAHVLDKTANGKSALDLARQLKRTKIVKLLQTSAETQAGLSQQNQEQGQGHSPTSMQAPALPLGHSNDSWTSIPTLPQAANIVPILTMPDFKKRGANSRSSSLEKEEHATPSTAPVATAPVPAPAPSTTTTPSSSPVKKGKRGSTPHNSQNVNEQTSSSSSVATASVVSLAVTPVQATVVTTAQTHSKLVAKLHDNASTPSVLTSSSESFSDSAKPSNPASTKDAGRHGSASSSRATSAPRDIKDTGARTRSDSLNNTSTTPPTQFNNNNAGRSRRGSSTVVSSTPPSNASDSKDKRLDSVGHIRYNRSLRLGTGSHGTQVYQGFYKSTPAAIKRMPRHTLAEEGGLGVPDSSTEREIQLLIALSKQPTASSSSKSTAPAISSWASVAAGKSDKTSTPAHHAVEDVATSNTHPLNQLIASGRSNIVRYFGKEINEDFIFLAMEQCAHTLQKLIKDSRAIADTFFMLYQEPITLVSNEELPPISGDVPSEAAAPGLRSSNGLLHPLLVRHLPVEHVRVTPTTFTLRLLLTLFGGIAYLHSLNIVHNDLKPANVLLTDAFEVKIADMGLAKSLSEEQSSFSFQAGPDGSFVAPTGLGGFFAPEVILEGRKTRKVDVFSAGCLAFYLLTLGGHPFELSGSMRGQRDSNIIAGRYDLSRLNHLPQAHDLVERMIQFNPSHRLTMAAALQHPLFDGVR